MNKTDLINAVAEQADLTKKEAGSAVDAVFESIQNSLSKGEKVQLIGFGNFEVRERVAGTIFYFYEYKVNMYIDTNVRCEHGKNIKQIK